MFVRLILCVQDAPDLMAAEVAAAMQSEYSTKYNTKSDSTDVNSQFLHVAAMVQDGALSPERRKTSLLCKMVNAINKTISYPLVSTASYVMMDGDAWFPLRTSKFDFTRFQRDLRRAQEANPYEDEGTDCTLTRGREHAHDDTDTAMDDSGDAEGAHPRRVEAVDDLTMYRCRNGALADWSPFEMCMAFECGPARTASANALELSASFPASVKYGHNPYTHVDHTPAIRMPQFFGNAPALPDNEAPDAQKEDYAAFALGNFYPYDSLLSRLEGDTLWAKYQDWRTREKAVRPEKDTFAFRCLYNIQVHCNARAQMRMESKKARVQRKVLRQALLRRNGGDGDREVGSLFSPCQGYMSQLA